MSADTMCRVCLRKNLKLYDVRNDLQNAYERITREKYIKVGYPASLCYICLSALQKCHKFMETARDNNKLLEQWYHSNQQNEITVAKPLCTYSSTKIYVLYTGNEQISLTQEIKQEKVELEEQFVDDEQADDSEFHQGTEITIEVKPEISSNDPWQVLSVCENPNDFNTDVKEEENECDSDTLVIDDLTEASTNVSKMSDSMKEDNNFSEYVSRRKSQLTARLSNTCDKPYVCNFCQYGCINKANMRRHLKIHTGEKPYACDTCKYRCSTRSDLKKHTILHAGEKPFKCNFCDYRSTRKPHMTVHMRTHTGEKPYSCSFCEYRCTQNSYLKIHMRLHTGEKPYPCSFCKHSFPKKSYLITHLKTHTGEKQFV